MAYGPLADTSAELSQTEGEGRTAERLTKDAQVLCLVAACWCVGSQLADVAWRAPSTLAKNGLNMEHILVH